MRIGRANDLREQCECGVVQPVFLQDGIEGNLFAMVPKFDIWDVEDDPVADARPVGVMRKEYEFRAGIDEPLDQPGAGDAAH